MRMHGFRLAVAAAFAFGSVQVAAQESDSEIFQSCTYIVPSLALIDQFGTSQNLQHGVARDFSDEQLIKNLRAAAPEIKIISLLRSKRRPAVIVAADATPEVCESGCNARLLYVSGLHRIVASDPVRIDGSSIFFVNQFASWNRARVLDFLPGPLTFEAYNIWSTSEQLPDRVILEFQPFQYSQGPGLPPVLEWSNRRRELYDGQDAITGRKTNRWGMNGIIGGDVVSLVKINSVRYSGTCEQ